MTKAANPDHPIHDLLAKRWSPYAFADRPVAPGDLRSLFEAARWAPSSYNEQPWSYLVACRHDEPVEFARLLSCLVDANRQWAQHASVLALAVVTTRFRRNDTPNAAAKHDLGLAAGGLCVQATARGLVVHQMIGILPDRARELYAIPEGSEALTGIAIGHQGDSQALPETLRARDLAARSRKPLGEFVFAGQWGKRAPLVGG